MVNASADIMATSVEPGIYKNGDDFLVVTTVATHENTRERMVVFRDHQNNILVCGEEAFLEKGLTMIGEKKSKLAWLWNFD